jgi:tRNA modification GTPase
VLYDTAGLREAAQEIEAEGISRTRHLMLEADLILYLYEDEKDLVDLQELSSKCIYVSSKADLKPEQILPEGHLACSVKTEHGLDALSEAILNRLKLPQEVLYRPLVTNARHLAALKRCLDALFSARQALKRCGI